MRRGMVGAWWAKLQRSMRPAAVVVGGVLGKDRLQVALAEDQDAVGEFGSGGADEAFGEAVLSRTARRDLHSVDPSACGVPKLGYGRYDLRLHAARSYSLISPPSTDRRLNRCRSRCGAG